MQLRDGRVLMLMRTALGGQYRSLSTDDGESWSQSAATGLVGTAAPVSIGRIPATGHLLANMESQSGYPSGQQHQQESPDRGHLPRRR